jgi:hypothetical protein
MKKKKRVYVKQKACFFFFAFFGARGTVTQISKKKNDIIKVREFRVTFLWFI